MEAITAAWELGRSTGIPVSPTGTAGLGNRCDNTEYNSIYPEERDTIGLTPGGQGLLETSVEARWRFGDRFGAAAFIDGGNAFDDVQDAPELRWGAGFGARYDLGFAPLRADIAIPLDPAQIKVRHMQGFAQSLSLRDLDALRRAEGERAEHPADRLGEAAG